MHFNLDKALQMAVRLVAILLFVSLLFILIGTALIGYSEFSRTRYLKQLRNESQIPKELTDLGHHFVASIFAANEDRICVFQSYTGIREVAEMSLVQKETIKNLELPSEELAWYLIAFQGDQITRVLLVDASIEAKLASRSRCFGPKDRGSILVRTQLSKEFTTRSIEFIFEENP